LEGADVVTPSSYIDNEDPRFTRSNQHGYRHEQKRLRVWVHAIERARSEGHTLKSMLAYVGKKEGWPDKPEVLYNYYVIARKKEEMGAPASHPHPNPQLRYSQPKCSSSGAHTYVNDDDKDDWY